MQVPRINQRYLIVFNTRQNARVQVLTSNSSEDSLAGVQRDDRPTRLQIFNWSELFPTSRRNCFLPSLGAGRCLVLLAFRRQSRSDGLVKTSRAAALLRSSSTIHNASPHILPQYARPCATSRSCLCLPATSSAPALYPGFATQLVILILMQ